MKIKKVIDYVSTKDDDPLRESLKSFVKKEGFEVTEVHYKRKRKEKEMSKEVSVEVKDRKVKFIAYNEKNINYMDFLERSGVLKKAAEDIVNKDDDTDKEKEIRVTIQMNEGEKNE